MIWPFSLLQKKPPPVVKPRNSMFTTEISALELSQLDPTMVLTRSFQRTPADLKPVGPDGKPYGASLPVATKDSHGVFAMDAASIGNVNSLKPLIEPNMTVPFAQLVWYASQGFIGYQMCAMVGQHWFIDKACVMPARDAVRHGYEIGTEEETEDEKVAAALAYMKKRDKAFRIKQNCVEFVRFNRMFGIRICMPIIDSADPDFYAKPFNIDGVKPGSYKGLSQIDPYWITPELSFEDGANPAAIHFYEPTWWRINGRRIHRSHLIVIRNGQVADILKPTYYYGGIPVPQKICERVYAAERTANEAPQLALTKRTTVQKMDITQAIAQLEKFKERMQFFTECRDNYGVKAIGLDDELEQFDTSLSDFGETIMSQYGIACAAAEVPAAKMMGTSPKGGLGSEGTYDTDSYHEFLESIQEHDMQPLIERHHLLLMKSEVTPKFGVEFTPVITWEPVDTPTAKEQAEIDKTDSETIGNYANMGAIDGVDVRAILIADKNPRFHGLADRVPEQPGNGDDTDADAAGGDRTE